MLYFGLVRAEFLALDYADWADPSDTFTYTRPVCHFGYVINVFVSLGTFFCNGFLAAGHYDDAASLQIFQQRIRTLRFSCGRATQQSSGTMATTAEGCFQGCFRTDTHVGSRAHVAWYEYRLAN